MTLWWVRNRTVSVKATTVSQKHIVITVCVKHLNRCKTFTWVIFSLAGVGSTVWQSPTKTLPFHGHMTEGRLWRVPAISMGFGRASIYRIWRAAKPSTGTKLFISWPTRLSQSEISFGTISTFVYMVFGHITILWLKGFSSQRITLMIQFLSSVCKPLPIMWLRLLITSSSEQGGNLMLAADCPTKRAAVMTDMTLGRWSHVPAFRFVCD